MADEKTAAPPAYSYPDPSQPGYAPAPSQPFPMQQYPPQPQPGYQPAYPGSYAPAVAQQTTSNTVVVATQPGIAATTYQTKPDNYLVLSIFSLLCCCWLFGIIALVHSLQVDSSWNRGDYEGARRSSASARTWNKVAIIFGIVATVVTVVVVILANVIPVIIVAASTSEVERINNFN